MANKQKLGQKLQKFASSILPWLQKQLGNLISASNELKKFWEWAFKNLFLPLIATIAKHLRNLINILFSQLKLLGQYLKTRLAAVWALILLLASLGIILAYFFPGTHIFEGNLIVQEMSFTRAGNQPEKLFLNNITEIKSLEIGGINNLKLTGKILKSSQSELTKLNQLNIQLPYPKSKLIIAPANLKQSSNLALNLKLPANTKVSQLIYNSSGNVLSLCLQSPEDKQQCSQHNGNLSPNSPESAISLGDLNLDLGEEPLKITLQGYKIPELNLFDAPNSPNPIELTFIPQQVHQLALNLVAATSLYISLPKLSEVDSTQWLRGNLDVKDVSFARTDTTGDLEDGFEISTILKGKVRMAKQELEIQPNQFLMAGNPGIKKLRYLQINPASPQGLQVRIAGEAENLEIGLDKKFAVESIRPSILARYLPPEAIAALLSFCAAVIGYLLPWLFTNSSEPQQKP